MECGLPKYEAPNPYNYTKVQLAKRKVAIKAMIRDFPNVSPMWCNWMYDIIENTPPEEVESIINEGKWEVPSKLFSKALGGTINSVEVFNEDMTPYIFPKEEEITAI
jgi:hypothetical protein